MPSSEPPREVASITRAAPLSFSAGGQVNTWVARAKDGKAAPYTYLWGLIPYWSKDPKKGATPVNARAETAQRKADVQEAHSRASVSDSGEPLPGTRRLGIREAKPEEERPENVLAFPHERRS